MERAAHLLELASEIDWSFRSDSVMTATYWYNMYTTEPVIIGAYNDALGEWRARGCVFLDRGHLTKWLCMLVHYVYYRMRNGNAPMIHDNLQGKYVAWAAYTMSRFDRGCLTPEKRIIVQAFIDRYGNSFFRNRVIPIAQAHEPEDG